MNRINCCGNYSRAPACYLHVLFGQHKHPGSISFLGWAPVCRMLLRVSPVPLLHKCGGAVCPSRPQFNSWPFSARSWLLFVARSQSVTWRSVMKKVCKSIEWFITWLEVFLFFPLMFSHFLFIHQESLNNCRYSALFSESFTVLIKILTDEWRVESPVIIDQMASYSISSTFLAFCNWIKGQLLFSPCAAPAACKEGEWPVDENTAF